MTQPPNGVQTEVAQLLQDNERLRQQYADALERIQMLEHDVEALHDVGIYTYRHPLETAVAYQSELASINAEIKAHVAEGVPYKLPPASRSTTLSPRAAR